MRLLLVLGFTTAFAISASAQGFIAPPGAPAKIFPKPQRAVADIVGPIWYEEKERDAVRETQQVVRLLGIKSASCCAAEHCDDSAPSRPSLLSQQDLAVTRKRARETL